MPVRRYSERLKRELDEAAGVNEQFITDKNQFRRVKTRRREHYISLRKRAWFIPACGKIENDH